VKDLPPVPPSWFATPTELGVSSEAPQGVASENPTSPTQTLKMRITELTDQLEQSQTVNRLTAELAALKQENATIKCDADMLVQTAKAVEAENQHLRKSMGYYQMLLAQVYSTPGGGGATVNAAAASAAAAALSGSVKGLENAVSNFSAVSAEAVNDNDENEDDENEDDDDDDDDDDDTVAGKDAVVEQLRVRVLSLQEEVRALRGGSAATSPQYREAAGVEDFFNPNFEDYHDQESYHHRAAFASANGVERKLAAERNYATETAATTPQPNAEGSAAQEAPAAPSVEATRYDLTLTAGNLKGGEAESEYAGQEWRFEGMEEGQVVPIGRSKTNKFKKTGLSLPKDGGVSSKHANVVLREGRLWYTDLGSSNGTELNGAEVPKRTEVELEDGAVLAIGDTQVTVSFKVQNGAAEEQQQTAHEPAIDVAVLQTHSPPRQAVRTLAVHIDFEEDARKEGISQRSRLTIHHDIYPESEPLFDAVELVRMHSLGSDVVEPLAKRIEEHVEMLREGTHHMQIAEEQRSSPRANVQSVPPTSHYSSSKNKFYLQDAPDQVAQHERFVQQQHSHEAQHAAFNEQVFHHEPTSSSSSSSSSSYSSSSSSSSSSVSSSSLPTVPWSPPGATGTHFSSEMGQTMPTPVVSVSFKSSSGDSVTEGRSRSTNTLENYRAWESQKDARYTIPIPTLQSIQRRWKATAQTANGQQCRKYYRTEHVHGVDLASFLHLVRSVLMLTAKAFPDDKVEQLHNLLLAGRDKLPVGDMFQFLRGSI
jgi:pSer/pThr/pTyr-binding forkhead associated (FHA) protein